jgi:hypothetical protein
MRERKQIRLDGKSINGTRLVPVDVIWRLLMMIRDPVRIIGSRRRLPYGGRQLL